MGKPLSRPDCLRQNPQCLGKGDEDEAYIEDCYVPQRSIYDTMRINEQIDQGTKLCQPSRSTLGSGGEGSTLSSNGTIGADLGSVFVLRNSEHAGGAKRLDERVIFDALKLTGDPQIMSPPVGIVGSGLPIAPSSSGSGVVAAVAKRRHQGGDKRDNPNRRSWKAFMPPSYPEFAERLEFSSFEGAEKRQSVAGISLSPLQPIPSHLPPSTPTSSTPSLPPYTPSPLSSAPHTPTVGPSPSSTPTVSPVPPLRQHPLSRQKQVHPVLQKQHRPTHVAPSPSKEQQPAFSQTHAAHVSGNTPQHSPGISRQVERRREDHRRTSSSSKGGFRQIPEETVESVKASDSERDSPLLDQDQGDNAPLLPPKPVFCPPTKARTWPRSLTTGKKHQVSLRRNFPVLPPLPPLLGEDSNTDEESLYLLDPPSPFLREEEGLVYGGLPLSPCISQEGGDEGLLGWGIEGTGLERTASELNFEEDERRILEELEAEEQEERGSIFEEEEEEEEVWQKERDKAEEERVQREEREWEAVLKLENREIIDQSWDRETLESEGWDVTGSTGHWPLLTPPTGFGGPGGPSASPCPSSGAESDDLFLELERQCQVDEGKEGVEMSVDPEPLDPYTLPCLEEEGREEEAKTSWEDFEGTLPLDAVNSVAPDGLAPDSENSTKDCDLNPSEPTNFDSVRAQDCEKEHGFIDEECGSDYNADKEEEVSYQTDSALGHQLESDSSGVHMSLPDRTGISDISQTDCEQVRLARTEADPDSGASSDCAERTPSPSRSLLNPYCEEVEEEEETEQDEAQLKEEEELETLWDVYDQSEPSLDCSEGALVDHSPEPPHTGEKEIAGECTRDVDAQTSCEEEPPPSEPIPLVEAITCDTEGICFASEIFVVPTDVVSGLDMSGLQDSDPETSTEVKASTPKLDSVPLVHLQHTDSSPTPSLPQSPPKSDSRGAGLDAKDSEAFVISDSFVYLAVSVPPQYHNNNCPPSPLEDSIPPSPVPKPPCCLDPEEEGALLSPDSFVYMAAPERPRPGPSDGCSACEDTQELDLDSYSEGTQSGMDGVEFVLGSVAGDSDWESDGSALDFPPLVSTDQVWDQLEPGLLQGLFTLTETSQAQSAEE
ncbi:microtubule-actin cross-linking factor 1, isoforms 6/7-like [Clinocottus analis]|uniref:microtubule-actin cross-linking factor 1, isoforms 6/7-like n=1 Tax=Clinocottus analis TaxID=304258 RepID=UPI0035C12E0E